jgi:hypothetical protein
MALESTELRNSRGLAEVFVEAILCSRFGGHDSGTGACWSRGYPFANHPALMQKLKKIFLLLTCTEP